VLVVAHGGTLYVLTALLGVSIEPAVLGNAQPLRFSRVGTTWRIDPLLARTNEAASLA
jgi:probable phosphoglycerate mutase